MSVYSSIHLLRDFSRPRSHICISWRRKQITDDYKLLANEFENQENLKQQKTFFFFCATIYVYNVRD